jgi:hypothetical protein
MLQRLPPTCSCLLSDLISTRTSFRGRLTQQPRRTAETPKSEQMKVHRVVQNFSACSELLPFYLPTRNRYDNGELRLVDGKRAGKWCEELSCVLEVHVKVSPLSSTVG